MEVVAAKELGEVRHLDVGAEGAHVGNTTVVDQALHLGSACGVDIEGDPPGSAAAGRAARCSPVESHLDFLSLKSRGGGEKRSAQQRRQRLHGLSPSYGTPPPAPAPLDGNAPSSALWHAVTLHRNRK